MRAVGTIALLAVALLSVAACGGDSAEHAAAVSPSTDAALPEQVRLAITIAGEIDDDPDQAGAILENHGMTEESFEQLMYDIAADPELSKAFEAARGK